MRLDHFLYLREPFVRFKQVHHSIADEKNYRDRNNPHHHSTGRSWVLPLVELGLPVEIEHFLIICWRGEAELPLTLCYGLSRVY